MDHKSAKTSKLAVASFVAIFLLWVFVYIFPMAFEFDGKSTGEVDYESKIVFAYLWCGLILGVIAVNIFLPIISIIQIRRSNELLTGKKFIVLSYLAFPLSLILFVLIVINFI